MAPHDHADDRDPTQLPAESRRTSRSKSELRKSESETHELSDAAAGRFEKKSRESESIESRSRSSETYQSGPGAGGGGESLGRDRGPGGRFGGGDSDWHARVPEQLRLSVQGVLPEGSPDAKQLDGDYILSLEHRSPLLCRWTLEFPECCGFSGLSLIATPEGDGQLHLRAEFSGAEAVLSGPAWLARLWEIDRALLGFDHEHAANPSAGCRWPEAVFVMALGARGGQEPWHISPEPTAEELALMASLGGIGSGGSCSSGEHPPCPDQEDPCDEDECCPPPFGMGGGNGGGGGDLVWFHALSGMRVDFLKRQSPAVRAHQEAWIADVGGRMGFDCHRAPARHIWHGDAKNRQYVTRDEILKTHHFDPDRHVEPAPATGHLRWTNQAPTRLRTDIRTYFLGRREDG